jgi:hypothetical protein
MVKVSAFAWVPPLRKDWCETFTPLGARRAGIAYEERLVGRKTKRQRAIAACSHSGKCPLTKTANSSYSSPAPSSCASQSIRWLPVSSALGLPL